MNAEFYVRGHGWLHRMDPRVKMFIVLAVIVMSCVWGKLIFLGAVLVLLHLFLLIDRTPVRQVLHVWKWLLPIDLIVCVILILSLHGMSGHILWQWNWITVTVESLKLTARVLLRISNIVIAWFLMLFTTSRTQWINGLARFGVPLAGGIAWVRVINYLPVYFAVKREVIAEEQTRGFKPTLLSGFSLFLATRSRIENRVARNRRAMRERGAGMNLEGKLKRTQYMAVKMRVIDWIDFILTILIIAGIITMMCFGW